MIDIWVFFYNFTGFCRACHNVVVFLVVVFVWTVMHRPGQNMDPCFIHALNGFSLASSFIVV